jgi:vancomycin aglycone glucosyltransferase
MKALLTTNGSRGEVQPLLGLAVELRALGHDAVICAAPNFQACVESFGIAFVPIGPDLEQWTRPDPAARQPPPSPAPDQWRRLIAQSVADQFRVLPEAARGCDLILVAGMLQVAGRSIAEVLGIPMLHAEYCAAALPSPDHPPAATGAPHAQSLPAAENRALWALEEQKFNARFRDPLNEQRAALGLPPVENAARHALTDHPWLAADPVLGPAGAPIAMRITQTGAWFLADPAPLPDEVEAFLAAGDPPLYFGFGSMRVASGTGQAAVAAARALGYRAILAQGWGHLDAGAAGADCLTIGAVDHAKLFPRVAAVAHHGGAGTTTAAARAGKPQVVVPHLYDQYYWGRRVRDLGIGHAGLTPADLTGPALAGALETCLQPETTARARALAGHIASHGARAAAERLAEAGAQLPAGAGSPMSQRDRR